MATTSPVLDTRNNHAGRLVSNRPPKVPVAHTCQASLAQGASNARSSQVTTSIKTTTTPTQQPRAAVQEDRVYRDAHKSYVADSLPMGQVRPAVQEVDDALDAHESRRGSAAPTGQVTSSVPAVQELATAHGEELELDGWDAEVGGHVGHQISGACDIDNRNVRARDVMPLPKWLHWVYTDEERDALKLKSVSTIRRRSVDVLCAYTSS